MDTDCGFIFISDQGKWGRSNLEDLERTRKGLLGEGRFTLVTRLKRVGI